MDRGLIHTCPIERPLDNLLRTSLNDFPQENKLVRELKDVAGKRPIFETIATQGQGVVELLDGLFTG